MGVVLRLRPNSDIHGRPRWIASLDVTAALRTIRGCKLRMLLALRINRVVALVDRRGAPNPRCVSEIQRKATSRTRLPPLPIR